MIVLKRYELLEFLVEEISKINRPHPIRIAIDGVFLLKPEIREYTLYIHSDFSVVLKRASS